MKLHLLITCFIVSVTVDLVRGRSWTTPKPFVTLPANQDFTRRAALFTFARFYTVEGSESEAKIDQSDFTFTLDFGKSIGTPVEIPCGDNNQCVNWMKGTTVVAQLFLSIDSFQPTKYQGLVGQTLTTSMLRPMVCPTVNEVTEINVTGTDLELISCEFFTSRFCHILQVSVKGPSHTYTFSHQGEYLYGGPVDDIYPSNEDTKKDAPYTTSEGGHKGPTKANNVVERVWYTSGGRGIRVSEETPLFVSQNNEQLILSVKNELPYPTKVATVSSKIEMVMETNVKAAWITMNAGRKTPSPPEISVKKAMISTWVAYKSEITQEKILDFVNIIKSKNLDIGIIGVDDGWETCYGSQIFDTKKFPDPKGMVDQLHKLGHTVTFWVHPFVNVDCEAHSRLQDYLVKLDDGTVVTSNWWNGKGGMINFLNETAANFYVQRLEKLQADYGIDGFKFDAGEVSYIPALNEKFTIDVPNQWTRSYVETAAKFGPLGEVRVGAGTTDQDIRMRLQDTNSVWTVEGQGLASVVPAMVQLTISGYAATIPDMIGGNAYGDEVGKELYVRWMQMTAFLPVMQFSILPWSFDDETLKLTQKYVALHEEYSPYMLDLFYSDDLTPVVAPLWWIEPNTKEALTCNDEFLVGDQILVAPVVTKGAVKRNIYFPEGVWQDRETGKNYTGPTTVKNFDAPLSKLPWFIKMRFDTAP